MSQQIGTHNPFKASFYERKAAKAQMDRSAYNDFKEWAKTNSPRIHNKLVREEEASSSAEAIAFAHLDDPQTLALWNEIEQLYNQATGKQHSAEYALVGVAPGATKREIYNAYRRKARKLHPDAGGDADAFKQLYAAYREILAVAKA